MIMVTCYLYDNLALVQERIRSNAPTISNRYGQRTFTEDGPWSSDDVTVTNRFGLRAGLTLAQPTGQFAVTNAWDASRRWRVVGGTAGTFTYTYDAGSAGVQPAAILLPGGGYLTNTYDTLARLTRTELRTGGGTILNAHGYQYNLVSQRL